MNAGRPVHHHVIESEAAGKVEGRVAWVSSSIAAIAHSTPPSAPLRGSARIAGPSGTAEVRAARGARPKPCLVAWRGLATMPGDADRLGTRREAILAEPLSVTCARSKRSSSMTCHFKFPGLEMLNVILSGAQRSRRTARGSASASVHGPLFRITVLTVGSLLRMRARSSIVATS